MFVLYIRFTTHSPPIVCRRHLYANTQSSAITSADLIKDHCLQMIICMLKLKKVWTSLFCFTVLFKHNCNMITTITATCWLRWEIALITRLQQKRLISGRVKLLQGSFFPSLFSCTGIGTLLPTDGRGAVRVSRGAGRQSVHRCAAPRTLTVGLPLWHRQLVLTSLNVAVVLESQEKHALILKVDCTCSETRMHSTS